MAMKDSKPHVAMFPAPGVGHFTPFMHLARVLAIRHGFSITFIDTQANVSHSEGVRAFSGLDIRVVECDVESQSVAGDSKSDDPFYVQWESARRSMPAFERILKTLISSASPICAVITDPVLTPILDISAKLNLPNYILFTSSALMLALLLYAPIFVSQGHDFCDPNLVLKIPGLPPIPAADIPPALKNKDSLFFRQFLSSGTNLRRASGVFVNTFDELERDFIDGIRSGRIAKDVPPIYPIGPLCLGCVEFENAGALALPGTEDDAARCLQWLDTQPAKSVVFVNFGSRSAMSAEQLNELAIGLEGSGQRFLWILRLSGVAPSASRGDVSTVLPPGFQHGVKGRGVVVSCWVPQLGILSHPSIGGFVSHCGWNSVVESISQGIPIIAWPQSGGDQMIIGRLMVENAKVGLKMNKGKTGVVSREEVEGAVKNLTLGEEGKALRRRAIELRDYARSAMAEGGSSHHSLRQAIKAMTMY